MPEQSGRIVSDEIVEVSNIASEEEAEVINIVSSGIASI